MGHGPWRAPFHVVSPGPGMPAGLKMRETSVTCNCLDYCSEAIAIATADPKKAPNRSRPRLSLPAHESYGGTRPAN